VTTSDISLRERKFDAFLSHAHADKAIVDRVHAWLTKAGIQLWYDATHLSPGAKIASELGSAISQCRAAIVVLSRASVDSGWVEDEWNLSSVERNRKSSRGFKVIPLRVEECVVPRFLEATKWVDLVGRMDDIDAWAELLTALAEEDGAVDTRRDIDLYVSCSWRSGREQKLVSQVLSRLRAPDLQLVGDSPNWPDFSGNRVRTLMRSCAGVVCVIPHRPRTADRDELKYFIQEARLADRLGLPLLVLAEKDAVLPPDLRVAARLDGDAPFDAETTAQLDEEVQGLLERCRRRPRAGKVFLAVEFDDALRARNELLRRVVQRCTGLTCVVGAQIGGDTVQRTIIELIRDAVWVVADLTDNPLNTCIEAGVALGAEVECTLVAREPYVRPPFMLRGPELKVYKDDLDLLAIVHREARLHRRRVLTE
jgi:hypothetical protein